MIRILSNRDGKAQWHQTAHLCIDRRATRGWPGGVIHRRVAIVIRDRGAGTERAAARSYRPVDGNVVERDTELVNHNHLERIGKGGVGWRRLLVAAGDDK